MSAALEDVRRQYPPPPHRLTSAAMDPSFVEAVAEIRTKFVRIWYEFRANFTLPEYSHTFIHVKFARNSYQIRTNFVRIYVNFFQLHANHTRPPQNLVVRGRGMVETLR